jgi:CheY-like chemotaxis protein
MDKEMPNLDGFQTTEELRKCGYKLPIIGLTGNAFEEQTEDFISHGANYVLTKPIDMNKFELIKAIYIN